MNKQQFLVAMNASAPPYAKDPVNFSDINCIPPEIADAEVYQAWYEHVVENRGAGADLTLAEIPLRFVTDDLRRQAIKGTVRSLIYIKPDEVEPYEDLLIYGLKESRGAFMMMDESFKTVQFLNRVIEEVPSAFDLEWNSQAWIYELLSTEMKERILLTNVQFALSLPDGEVSKEHWTHLCKTSMYCPEILEGRGRLDIFSEFLREGNWPDLDPEIINFKRTEDITEIADLFTQIPDEYYEHRLYQAKLLTFPVQDIVKAMDSLPKVNRLMQLFPEAELRNHMRFNRTLRGMLLENDLGM